jgi:hypothetical protein
MTIFKRNIFACFMGFTLLSISSMNHSVAGGIEGHKELSKSENVLTVKNTAE